MTEKLLLGILFAIIFWSTFIFIFKLKTKNKVNSIKKEIADLKRSLEK